MGSAIIVIDDQSLHAETLCDEINLLGDINAGPRWPSEVTIDDLRDAHLVVVDYDLSNWHDEEKWCGPDSLQPRNGIALAETLAQQVWGNEPDPPTGFALITGKPGALMKPLPHDGRLHVIARTIGLEWVFEKDEQGRAEKIMDLANGIASLPQDWSGNGQDKLLQLLQVQKSGSLLDLTPEDFQSDILRCMPPIHEISEWTHGLAIIRWLTQRIIPYPTFLLSKEQVLARCGISIADLPSGSSLDRLIPSARYTGALWKFAPPQWWRVGVEHYLWRRTEGSSFDIPSVQKVMADDLDISLASGASSADRVLCYDENLTPIDKLQPIEASVRIHPDDWPGFADQPWTLLEHANESDRLRNIVIYEDWHRLKK